MALRTDLLMLLQIVSVEEPVALVEGTLVQTLPDQSPDSLLDQLDLLLIKLRVTGILRVAPLSRDLNLLSL